MVDLSGFNPNAVSPSVCLQVMGLAQFRSNAVDISDKFDVNVNAVSMSAV